MFPQRGLLAPTTALAASFYWFDRWWADARCDPTFTQHGWDDSGSTAVVGMVYGQDLVVANAGVCAGRINWARPAADIAHSLSIVPYGSPCAMTLMLCSELPGTDSALHADALSAAGLLQVIV